MNKSSRRFCKWAVLSTGVRLVLGHLDQRLALAAVAHLGAAAMLSISAGGILARHQTR